MKTVSKLALAGVALILIPGIAFAAAQTEGTGAEAGEPMTITWHDENTDSWVLDHLKEKLNVNIVPNGIAWGDVEQTQLMLAAGEFPDCGPLRPTPQTDPLELYNQAVTRGIPKDAIRANAPNYAELVSKYPIGWLVNQNPEDEEELLAIGGVLSYTDANLTSWPSTRIDWIRNVGMDLSEYDEEKIALDKNGRLYFLDQDVTLDWVEELLYAYREGDPDQNGKNDTIPFSGSGIGSFGCLMGAYGISNGDNQYVDGELYDFRIHPNMPRFLTRMQKWYADGLIDDELTTMDTGTFREKVAAGLVGFINGNMIYAGNFLNRPPNTFVPEEEVGTGAEAVMLPPPVGPDGDQGSSAFNPIPVGHTPFFVNNEVGEAKLAKILEVINYKATPEGMVAFRFGRPGVDFEWEGEPWESAALGGMGSQEQFSIRPFLFSEERLPLLFPKKLAEHLTGYVIPRTDLTYHPARHDLFNEQGVSEIESKYGSNLQTLFEEFFFKGLTGTIDIDAEWDTYVSKWRNSGGDELLEALGSSPLFEPLAEGEVEY